MGARPMARVIQEHIKKPLADEVLFGKLKAGGHVKVILAKDEQAGTEMLGFEYLDGPITPKPERIPGGPKPKRARRKSPKPKGGPSGPSGRGALPKVPLVKV
jgi:ATP-dependent Clp protease ATP-binding subunit ClpA